MGLPPRLRPLPPEPAQVFGGISDALHQESDASKAASISSSAGNSQAASGGGTTCDCHAPTTAAASRNSSRSQARNLVVCIDGTANQFSLKNSNVVELYSRLHKDDYQLTYYDSGIGTYVKEVQGWRSWLSYDTWKQGLINGMDMAIAWNFKTKILNAYQWLSENYRTGDKIFLFGFSRGAYQVRVIAGMLERVGLLHKGNYGQIAFAYDLYSKSSLGKRLDKSESGSKEPSPDSRLEQQSSEPSSEVPSPSIGSVTGEDKALCDNFKKTLCRPVKAHFVGVWDTVSSIGISRRKNLPEIVDGMDHVCAFRQALALDECRVKFLPEYANGGAGPSAKTDHVKEVWFPGSHSDIGGGNEINTQNNLFSPSLRWMTYEAVVWGLRVEHYEGREPPPPTLKLSMSLWWRMLEYIPLFIPRLSYSGKDDQEYLSPHLGNGRIVQKYQFVHTSVFKREQYEPKASLFTGVKKWSQEDLRSAGIFEEPELYYEVNRMFDKLREDGRMHRGGMDILRTHLSTHSKDDHGLNSILAAEDAYWILQRCLSAEYDKLIADDSQEGDMDVFETLVSSLEKFKSRLDDQSRAQSLTDLWAMYKRKQDLRRNPEARRKLRELTLSLIPPEYQKQDSEEPRNALQRHD